MLHVDDIETTLLVDKKSGPIRFSDFAGKGGTSNGTLKPRLTGISDENWELNDIRFPNI